ncbi:ATP-binding protein [Flavisolibacter sp. BT320]|nr:ATP-binding protein [Flavisolibacter longurius]
MRYLNKIVFINSATIRYADVRLDGNVHLIGTQGVGKSTLLRAILFFYNGDTLRLGIPREKKSFADYYFPFQNAYLVYEVMRETGPYCVLLFKSQGRVCFRFVDAAYDQQYFLSPEGKAYESWEDTRRLLDEDGIHYSRKVDRYDEYRDILYGSNEGKKEFRKYALLESRQYQNIPRTIQNVFLNSKLEAEFIKQTIILSLNEEDLAINLQNYAHHLKSFEAQLTDINRFKQPAVAKQGAEVVNLYAAVGYLQKEKEGLARQLAAAFDFVQRTAPKLLEKKEREEEAKKTLKERLGEAEKRFQNRIQKLREDISVVNDKLATIKQKTAYYEGLNIEQVVQRVAKKSDLEAEEKKLLKEKALLSAQFTEVTRKYEALFLSLEESHRAFALNKEGQRLQLREEFLRAKDEARMELDELLAAIRQQHQQTMATATQETEEKGAALQEWKLKKEATRHQRFYETEIAEAEKELSRLTLAIQQGQNAMAHANEIMETLQKQWQLDEAAMLQKAEAEEKDLRRDVAVEREALSALEQKLQKTEQSFYGWLNQHYPGWEATIGKVCDEQLLFRDDLSPLLQEASRSLYGVQIQLSGIEKEVKTVAEYETEKEAVHKQMLATNEQLNALQEKKRIGRESLKNKYGPKLIEQKETVREHRYHLEQNQQKQKQTALHLLDLQQKAATEKQQTLAAMDEGIAAAAEALLQAQQALATIRNEEEKQVRKQQTAHQKKLEEAEQRLKEAYKKIDVEIKTNEQEYQLQKGDISRRQEAELAGKGADTRRLHKVETLLQGLQQELAFIEENREVVAVYKRDKVELLDRAGELKNGKALLEQEVLNEETKYRQKKGNLEENLQKLEEAIRLLAIRLQQAEEDQQAFERFQVTETFLNISTEIWNSKEGAQTEKRCKTLIEELHQCDNKSIRRVDDLKDAVNRFLGHFSPDNIFHFPTNLPDKEAYFRFARSLDDFLADRKMDEYERRVNERFSFIIHLIRKETGNLLAKSGDILKVINQINRDFERKNFVGAIKKIELRLSESQDAVVLLLQAIKTFGDENDYDLGGANLFATQDQEAKNKKAISLLLQLVKLIGEAKRESITLSDSFELEFRIQENQNDTGWVEKLSHVGSEGTDVLVKAMVNIMLLNVFKEGVSKKFANFRLHCMMDEIGKLHPNNVKGILQFANDRDIYLINGSPTESNALSYKHIYKLEKDEKSFTRVKRIVTNKALV